MDADRALKTLFKLRATDLLPVTGDRGAEVLSRQVPELNAVTRRLDFVLKLKSAGSRSPGGFFLARPDQSSSE